jgi:histidyl-tRNA synthetase
MSGDFQAPKGVSEYLPPRSSLFEIALAGLTRPALAAGYKLIELPIFEDTALFERGVGETTDVVSKEMYTFEDRGGRSLTLRPEGTAGVMRAVIEHGLDRGQLPVKLFYRGPFFRAERPQAGRYRQFYQFGIEAIGVDDPYLDAEVISIANDGFRGLGLTQLELQISSLGDADSRLAHRKELLNYLAKIPLDEETRARAEKNPLRLFDDKRESIQRAMKDAPLLQDFLSSSSRSKFEVVQRVLQANSIPFTVNPRMVRGLDYYTDTTFEFIHHGLGAQSSIGGGGRYSGLMESLGGQPLSGIGFGLGIDRTVLAMESEGLAHRNSTYFDLYLIALGDRARDLAFAQALKLRKEGFVVDLAFGERGLKGAMKAADKLGARYTAVLGDSEVESGRIELKEMSSGESKSITLDSLATELISRR